MAKKKKMIRRLPEAQTDMDTRYLHTAICRPFTRLRSAMLDRRHLGCAHDLFNTAPSGLPVIRRKLHGTEPGRDRALRYSA